MRIFSAGGAAEHDLCPEANPVFVAFASRAVHRGVHRGTGTALPPGLTATLMVVPGEFTDAERYGALAAADAHAVALVSEGPARERVLR